ncbi:MAG: MiaB/RimO family radical SAM methylthiotransferase [Phycisphaerales bacterium]|jgi:tRNA-2-methylthio-N6-dimethylallyladenosine synthase|nr:MiaB/RimO family radical SAM methylthiotransferase [Phycisphaerales bacterium]
MGGFGRRSVYLETFGCQMNELDSELVAGQLASLGYRFVPEAERADVILYNTCSVREQAEQKVWSRLGELKSEKRARPGLVVGVLGCLAEREGAALIRRMPVVDVLCGPGELDKLPALLDNALRTRESMLAECEGEACTGAADGALDVTHAPLTSAGQVALQGSASRRSATLAAAGDSLELLDLSRSVSPIDPDAAKRRSAYVRITRGCNKFCTYCVVPFTRGAEIHRPPAHIVDECRRLADQGVIEVTLLGQTVNHYRFEHDSAETRDGVLQPQKGRAYKPFSEGMHRRDPFAGSGVTTFADLLHEIHEKVPEILRLRFVTSYPRDFGDDVLQVMRDCPRICRYLHVPAQSGSNEVLRRMNRGYTIEEYDEFVARARSFLDQPEIGRPLMLSGDIIVGFPGETDADYEKTVDLVRRSRYKNCFIFKYSPRPGTLAYDKIPDDVPEEVKRARNNHLLSAQSEISDEISRAQVGRTFDALVEGVSKRTLKSAGLSKGQIRKSNAVMLTINGLGNGSGGHDGDACDDGACSGATGVMLAGAETASEHSTLAGMGESPVQMTARTDSDLIVFFDAPANRAESMVGSIVRVRVDGADRLALHATRV